MFRILKKRGFVLAVAGGEGGSIRAAERRKCEASSEEDGGKVV